MKSNVCLANALLAIPMAVLYGCATTADSFVDSTASDAASLQGRSFRESGIATNWESYSLYAVDGKRIARGPFEGGKKTLVDPGAHHLVIYAGYNRGFFSEPSEAYLELPAFLKPSTSYTVTGRVASVWSIEVWLEDAATKERVSEVRAALPRKQPRELVIPTGPAPRPTIAR